MSDHQGIHRTLALIQRRYCLLNMRQEVIDFIQACDKCAQRKDGNIPKARLGEHPVANKFLEILATDFIGSLPTTKDGNRYILTFVDHFTMYCFAIPLPEQTAERVAYELVHKTILEYGTPQYLLFDQGTQFLSKVIQETCRLTRFVSYQLNN